MKPAAVSGAPCHASRGGHTDDVQHERYEPMVGSEGEQDAVDQQNVLEVVNDALAIQEVHGGAEEVPVERLGEAQAAGLAGHIGDGNDLLERNDLHGGDNDDDVDVAGAEDPEEAHDHHEGPYGAGYEVGLLLLVLARWGLLGSLRPSAGCWARKRGSAYWRRCDTVLGGARGLRVVLAELGHALRGPPCPVVAGAPGSMLELDVLARARHAGELRRRRECWRCAGGCRRMRRAEEVLQSA
jgi:hypothetical protein